LLDSESISVICENALERDEAYLKKNHEISTLGQKLTRLLDKNQLKLFLEYESMMVDLEQIIATTIYKQKAV
jgi:hypothetical protein